MRNGRGWVVAFVLCAACTSGEPGTGPPGKGGTGGQGTGGSATGGAAGASGSAGGGGCDEILVKGSVDGQNVDGVLGLNRGASGNAFQDWQSLKWVTGGGWIAFGTGGANTGDSVAGKALLSAPIAYDLKGRQLFADKFAYSFGDGSKPATLDSLRDLGTCPGTPAVGTINLCSDFGGFTPLECADDFVISGSLDGVSLDATYVEGSVSWIQANDGEDRVAGLYDIDGYMILQGDPGKLQGVITLPPTHPAGAKVICVGEATRTEVGEHSEYELRNLSVTGATWPGTPISGSLEIVNCK